MKKLTVLMSLLMAVTMVVACGDQRKSSVATRVGQGGGRGVPPKGQGGFNAPTPQSPYQAQIAQSWGVVNPQAGNINDGGQSYMQNANDVVRFFLSTDWNFAEVGATTVSADSNYSSTPETLSFLGPARPCVTGQNCAAGLTIGTSNNTQVTPLTFLNSQRLSQVTAGNQKVGVMGGGLTLVFWDSFTGHMSVNENPEMINPIPVFIPLDSSRSFVQGNQATLVFSDLKGSVAIQGNINGSLFQGSIQFNNSTAYGESASIGGALGSFSISACAVFNCN